jgi:hypothetical protein
VVAPHPKTPGIAIFGNSKSGMSKPRFSPAGTFAFGGLVFTSTFISASPGWYPHCAVMPMSPNIDDRPSCSKCNVEMLRGIAEPIVPGYELRNFECPSCGNKLKLVGYEGPIKTMSKPE